MAGVSYRAGSVRCKVSSSENQAILTKIYFSDQALEDRSDDCGIKDFRTSLRKKGRRERDKLIIHWWRRQASSESALENLPHDVRAGREIAERVRAVRVRRRADLAGVQDVVVVRVDVDRP